MKRLITFFLLTLLCFAPISYGLGKANSNHIIAGYGPVAGELFAPTNVQFFEDKMLVLDQFGISTFDVSTRKYLSRFAVDFGRTDDDRKEVKSNFLEDQSTWINLFKNFSKSSFLSYLVPKGSGKVDGLAILNEKYKFSLDSTGNCYIFTTKGIQVYQSDGTLLKSLPIPENKDIEQNQDFASIESIKIYQDKLFLYRYFVDENFDFKLTMFIIGLNGEVEKKIKFNPDLFDKIFFSPNGDFVYLSDLKLFCFNGAKMTDFSFLPFVFINQNGDLVESKHDLDIVSPNCWEMGQDNRIVFYAQHTKSLKETPTESVFTVTYQALADQSILISKESSFEHELIKRSGIDLAWSNSRTALIVKSPNYWQSWDHQILLIQDQDVVRVGSSPIQNPSQIFGSMAYCVDDNGNLFTNNLTDLTIKQFGIDGTFKEQIDCPIEVKGFLDIPIKPVIYDMCYLNDSIYFTAKASENLLIKYSIPEKKWSSSPIIIPNSKESPTFLSMQIDKNQIYLLDTNKINKNTPNLFVITQNENGESIPEQIKLRDYPEFNKKKVPVFIDFKIIDSDYYFLECVNQEIWIYDKEKGLYKDRILLPKSDKNFYSSLLPCLI